MRKTKSKIIQYETIQYDAILKNTIQNDAVKWVH